MSFSAYLHQTPDMQVEITCNILIAKQCYEICICLLEFTIAMINVKWILKSLTLVAYDLQEF